MSEPQVAAAPTQRKRLLKRVLPLVFLGAAIGLVVVQVTRMVYHEVTLQLTLSPAFTSDLSALELLVTDPEETALVSTVVFRFDAAHPPAETLAHTLRLVSGDYRLQFKLLRGEQEPQVITRRLQVSASTLTRFTLP